MGEEILPPLDKRMLILKMHNTPGCCVWWTYVSICNATNSFEQRHCCAVECGRKSAKNTKSCSNSRLLLPPKTPRKLSDVHIPKISQQNPVVLCALQETNIVLRNKHFCRVCCRVNRFVSNYSRISFIRTRGRPNICLNKAEFELAGVSSHRDA
ncbi:hypothetical protein IscW_ISCW024153 [Ixodes scapularis]|uniref:Uncharacterized protein n=1 Tax=Ixodes scapularis TaxID=6945 RepID=B7P900_IXOSC|nr:hypothetical protein IscW_ISCW024153 [Ixodes scapularis]|eukprot:XP_002403452.1 hypothetical protein IscW_ISCW024153 [Ixodes scapularis]